MESAADGQLKWNYNISRSIIQTPSVRSRMLKASFNKPYQNEISPSALADQTKVDTLHQISPGIEISPRK